MHSTSSVLIQKASKRSRIFFSTIAKRWSIRMAESRTSQTTRLSFEDVLGMIMRLQGDHASKVTDIVDLRKFVQQLLNEKFVSQQLETDHKLDEIGGRLEQLCERVGMGVQVSPEGSRSGQAWVQSQPMVDVSLTLKGKTKTRIQRHVSSLTIGQLLQDFTPEHGPLVAHLDALPEHGPSVELAPYLIIGNLAVQSAGKLSLHLVPAGW